jgi:replicative DNA helicase
MDDIVDRFDNKRSAGIRCGYDFIDNYTHGYKPGELIIIGARTSVGKTTFAINQAVHMAKRGVAVGFITIEMMPKELVLKMIGMEGHLDSSDLESDEIHDFHITKAAETREKIIKLPIIIKYAQSDDAQKMINAIKVMKSKYNIGVCVVDYLQEFHMYPSKETRNLEVGRISGMLKNTAMNIGIPIIALSQLSKPPSKFKKAGDSEDKYTPPPKPTLSALRDSGEIEQDANIVILLHTDNPLKDVVIDLDVEIAKNRSGQLGDTTMRFNKKQSTIEEYL